MAIQTASVRELKEYVLGNFRKELNFTFRKNSYEHINDIFQLRRP